MWGGAELCASPHLVPYTVPLALSIQKRIGMVFVTKSLSSLLPSWDRHSLWMRFESLKRCQHIAIWTRNTDSGWFYLPSQAMTWPLWEKHARLCCVLTMTVRFFCWLALQNTAYQSWFFTYLILVFAFGYNKCALLWLKALNAMVNSEALLVSGCAFHPEKLMMFFASGFLFSSSACSKVKYIRVL